jgi:hypothetical protein
VRLEIDPCSDKGSFTSIMTGNPPPQYVILSHVAKLVVFFLIMVPQSSYLTSTSFCQMLFRGYDYGNLYFDLSIHNNQADHFQFVIIMNCTGLSGANLAVFYSCADGSF